MDSFSSLTIFKIADLKSNAWVSLQAFYAKLFLSSPTGSILCQSSTSLRVFPSRASYSSSLLLNSLLLVSTFSEMILWHWNFCCVSLMRGFSFGIEMSLILAYMLSVPEGHTFYIQADSLYLCLNLHLLFFTELQKQPEVGAHGLPSPSYRQDMTLKISKNMMGPL